MLFSSFQCQSALDYPLPCSLLSCLQHPAQLLSPVPDPLRGEEAHQEAQLSQTLHRVDDIDVVVQGRRRDFKRIRIRFRPEPGLATESPCPSSSGPSTSASHRSRILDSCHGASSSDAGIPGNVLLPDRGGAVPGISEPRSCSILLPDSSPSDCHPGTPWGGLPRSASHELSTPVWSCCCGCCGCCCCGIPSGLAS